MMGYLIRLALVVTCLGSLPVILAGQNLVPNGSFEELDASCQFGISYDGVADWRSLACGYTPGYANACNNPLNNGSGVPQNGFGYAPAHSGSAMIALPTVLDSPPDFPLGNPRAYANVPLVTPLITGGHYCLRLWINMADSSCYKTDVLHAFVGYGLPSLCNQVDTTWSGIATATWNISDVDTATWTVLESEFTAQGGEENLTIGAFAFGADIHATFLADHSSLLGGNISWYFIDDVELWACQVGINQAEADQQFSLYPNPADAAVTVSYHGRDFTRVELYDVIGQLVTPATWSASRSSSGPSTFDTSGIPSGRYVVRVIHDHGPALELPLIVAH